MNKKEEYSREQLADSLTFGYSRDLVRAVLEEGKRYTKEAARKKILAYLEGETEERGN